MVSGRGYYVLQVCHSTHTRTHAHAHAQNHLSGSGTCEVDDRRYQLVMNLFHGNDITSLTSQSFSPQGMNEV